MLRCDTASPLLRGQKLLVGGACQRLQLLLRHGRAGHRVAVAAVEPVEGAGALLFLEAEARVGAARITRDLE